MLRRLTILLLLCSVLPLPAFGKSKGPATVVVRPDSSRYLDIAVVLGNAWRPPAQPFNP